ncbi:MAG TPA: M28 family peptidase [Planctomycetota bacterium]|nr:M28 family peptidase [Planctomycetota bacterium]
MSDGSKRGPLRTAGFVLASAAALSCCLFLFSRCGGGPKGPVDGARAYSHLEKIVGFGPRPFGSDALAKTADYITGELKALGLEPKRQEVVDEKEKKTIRNLYVQIDGDDPANGPILMVAAHYDTKLAAGHSDAAHNFPFVGAIDGGGGPAVLLELARVLKERQPKPKVNVWLYWIDAEESLDWVWNNDRALLGSKAFCKMLSETKVLPRVKAFVLLDLIGDKNYKIDKDGNSDGRLQELFERAGKALGVAERMYEFPTPNEVAYYKQKGVNWGTTDDHNTFSAFGVPSVLLIDFARRVPPQKPGEAPQVDERYTQWWHTPDDDLSQTSPDALAFAGDLVMQAFPDLEAFCLPRK